MDTKPVPTRSSERVWNAKRVGVLLGWITFALVLMLIGSPDGTIDLSDRCDGPDCEAGSEHVCDGSGASRCCKNTESCGADEHGGAICHSCPRYEERTDKYIIQRADGKNDSCEKEFNDSSVNVCGTECEAFLSNTCKDSSGADLPECDDVPVPPCLTANGYSSRSASCYAKRDAED